MPINPLAGGPDDQELEKKNKAVADEGSSTNVGNVGQAVSGGSAPQAQNSSGSFVNLNQYTEANKDQGAGLGGKIAQNVQNTANQGLTQLGQSQQEFNKAEESAGVNAKDYDVDKLTGIAQSVYNDPTKLQQADIDAANTARTKAAAFKAGSDTGPKALGDLTSFQQAAGTLQGAQDKANLTGTESGRETLLRDTYKRPDYSKGQSGLDQLLTQNVPQNRERFESLRTNLLGQYGLGDQQNQAIQAAAQKRDQVSQDTQQAAGNVNQALWGKPEENQQGGVLGSYQQQLVGRADQLNKEQADNIAKGKQAIQEYFNQNGINTMGIPVDQLVNQIVQGKSGVGAATLANTVSAQDLARINALNKLAGRDPNLIGDKSLSAVDSNQFNSSINPNYTAAQDQINQRVNTYTNDVKSIANSAVTGNLGQAYGRDIIGPDNVSYATGRVNKNMNNPAYDLQENNKIVGTLENKLNDINATRAKYGLGRVDVNYVQEIVPAIDQKWNEILTDLKNGLPRYWNDKQKQDYANTFMRDRVNTPFGEAVKAAGRVSATYNKLQALQSNPTMQVGTTSLQNTPTFMDTSGWPTLNGKKINPANIISYTPPGGQTSGGGRMLS